MSLTQLFPFPNKPQPRIYIVLVFALVVLLVHGDDNVPQKSKQNSLLNKIVKRQAPVFQGGGRGRAGFGSRTRPGGFGGSRTNPHQSFDFSGANVDLNNEDISSEKGGDISASTQSRPDIGASHEDLGPDHTPSECDYCVENSNCVYDKCECADGFTGEPLFYCVDPSEYHFCYTQNDPEIRTLGGEKFVHHVMGSTRLVQMSTERDDGGICRFWLWGWTERYKGKQYYGGLSFRLDQQDTYGLVTTRRGHITATGEAGGGYTWQTSFYGPGEQEAKFDTFSDDDDDSNTQPSPFVGNAIGGCDATSKRIAEDFMEFEVGCCGLAWAIRPFHPDHPEVIPGWWFQVDRKVYPSYETWDSNEEHTEPLCLDHYQYALVDDLIEGTGISLGKREALSYHAMTNTPFSEYPTAPEGLELFKILLRNCDKIYRNDLLELIYFFFDNPKLINCLNGAEGSSIESNIEAIEYVASLVCNDATDGCEPLTVMIEKPECQRVRDEFPELNSLINPSGCGGGMHNDFLIQETGNGGFWFQ